MRRRTNSWSAALLVLGLALACGGGEEEAEPVDADTTQMEELSVASVELGRSIGNDNRVREAVDTFAPGDTIYAAVETAGSAASATLSARWSFEDGQVINESNRTIRPSGTEVTEFHVSKPDGWPTGTYTVQISLDGETAASEEFSVEAGG